MKFLKKFFDDENRIIGLCGFKSEKEYELKAFVPKFNPAKQIYNTNYQKNFFLL